MKRLIIFNASSFIYGAERGLINLVKALSGRFDITVVLPKRGPVEEKLRRADPAVDIRIFPLAVLTRSLSPFYYVGFTLLWAVNLFYFTFFIIFNKIGIVCANSLLLTFPAVAANFAKKQHIWYVREFFESVPLNSVSGKIIDRFADVVLCQSETIKKRLFLNRGRVIYEPLDESEYKQYESDAARDRLGIPRDAAVMAVVSRIHPSKGQLEFIREIKGSLRGSTKLFLIIAGDITPRSLRNRLYKRKIEWLVKKENLNNVRLLGFRDDIDRILSISDVCVFPFKREEPFGIAVAEALAFGKATIFSRIGGPEEVYNIFNSGEKFVEGRLFIPEALSFQTYKEKILPIFENRYGTA